MVHKQVHIGAKLTYIPVEDLGLRSLEHDSVGGKLAQDALNDIGPPILDILCDALTLNHNSLDASVIDEALAEIDDLGGVRRAKALERTCLGVTAGSELDSNLGLGNQAGGMDFVYETHPVVRRNGQESGGDLHHVEAERLAALQISIYRRMGVRLREHMLDPATLLISRSVRNPAHHDGGWCWQLDSSRGGGI